MSMYSVDCCCVVCVVSYALIFVEAREVQSVAEGDEAVGQQIAMDFEP